MTKQSKIFLEGEGDAWHLRNIGARKSNQLLGAMCTLQIAPQTVLEFGCGTGWRLEDIRQQFGSVCFGIDPSKEAIQLGQEVFEHLNLRVGTVETIHPHNLLGEYELVIFGFCLYLIDREYLFHVVEKADDFLAEGGYLAIHDFDPEPPQVVPYHHKPGVYSYKMDHAKLWLANPAYELIVKVRITHEESISILRKNSWDQFK